MDLSNVADESMAIVSGLADPTIYEFVSRTALKQLCIDGTTFHIGKVELSRILVLSPD